MITDKLTFEDWLRVSTAGLVGVWEVEPLRRSGDARQGEHQVPLSIPTCRPPSSTRRRSEMGVGSRRDRRDQRLDYEEFVEMIARVGCQVLGGQGHVDAKKVRAMIQNMTGERDG